MKRFKKVYIEITNICNKNCSFCSSNNRPLENMSLVKFEHILKEIQPYTDYIYLHVKGEPLLHPEFPSILDLCKKYQMKVNITTNATLLKKYAEIIKQNPFIYQINISLQSFEENTACIDEILTTVEELLHTTSIYFCYRFWALKDYNITPIHKKIIEKIFCLHKIDREVQKQIATEKNITLKPRLFLNKGNMFTWPSMEQEKVSSSMCYGLKTHFAILVDGTVVPCCLDASGIINLGNIFTTPLQEIINSERVLAIIRGFEESKCQEELCQRCTYRLFHKKML